MAEKLHKPTDNFFSSIAKEYKRCRLVDRGGALLVNYNAIKTPIKEKLKEVKRRLGTLPEGIYVLQCQYTLNPQPTPVDVLIQKGNATLGDNEEIIVPARTTVVKEQRKENEFDIYSTKAALARIEELAMLKAENTGLKIQLAAAQKQVEELEAELDDAETSLEENEGKAGGILGLLNGNGGEDSPLKMLGEMIPTALDSYFKIKNRELDLKERGLNKQGGTSNGQTSKRFKVVKRSIDNTAGQLDLSDNEKIDKYLNIMEGLEENEFKAEVERIKEVQPALFGMVCEEFGLDEEGAPVEEEEEEES